MRFVHRYIGFWLLLTVLGCQSLRLDPPAHLKQEKPADTSQSALPHKHQLRVSQFVFLSDFELKKDLPIFSELSDMRDQLFKELQLPAGNAMVQVYVFEDREVYEAYMKTKYPELPNRRAFFVAQPHSVGGTEDLLVYTYWSDRVKEDLRHELTHALLHSVLKDVPLWLDEGLAEYYEVSPEKNAINARHVDLLLHKGDFHPDMARLEQFGEVKQMESAEYREAWAWVHLMLRGNPEAKKVLIAYLHELRKKSNPGPLNPRIAAVMPKMNETLVTYVGQLEKMAARD